MDEACRFRIFSNNPAGMVVSDATDKAIQEISTTAVLRALYKRDGRGLDLINGWLAKDIRFHACWGCVCPGMDCNDLQPEKQRLKSVAFVF